MGFTDFSTSRYQFKSVWLRTNEEFVRLYNDATEARRFYFQTSALVLDVNFDDFPSGIRFPILNSRLTEHAVRGLGTLQHRILDADRMMKRAEKYAELSEVLAGIRLQFEQEIFPALRKYHCLFEEKCLSVRTPAETLLIDQKNFLQDVVEVFAESVSLVLESAHKVVVSALALLSFVYQYLIGCVDKGGSKTYSPGSFLFRLIFVAIVLFLGSYVWIKSRQVSFTANHRKRKSDVSGGQSVDPYGDQPDVPDGVYRRTVRYRRGSVTRYKYEPRFKPGREKLESGTSLKFNCLSLGWYDTRREAKIVRHIAAVLYGKEEGRPVQFEDGPCLPFPSVTELEKCPPSGKEKAVWVTQKTKELFAELLQEKARRSQPLHPAVETGSHCGHAGEASRSDPSPSAPRAPGTAVQLTYFTSPHGGNGVVEEPTTSEPHGLGQEPAPAREVFAVFFPDSDFEQAISSMPFGKQNGFPGIDDVDQIASENFETDPFLDFQFPSVPPLSSALDIPTLATFPCLPQSDGAGHHGLEIIEPHLNSATAIPFQQLESLPEQVQLHLRVTCQEQRPGEFSGSDVELQQKLLEYEVRNSELEQKLRQSEVENDNWRSMFPQVAKFMSSFQPGLRSC